MPSDTDIGARLLAFREARGLSQRALAALIESHQPTIALVEKGRQTITVAFLSKLAIVYGCSVADLVAVGQPIPGTSAPEAA